MWGLGGERQSKVDNSTAVNKKEVGMFRKYQTAFLTEDKKERREKGVTEDRGCRQTSHWTLRK